MRHKKKLAVRIEVRSIQQAMTPEAFKTTGLKRLSPEELQELDAWLKRYFRRHSVGLAC